jgi:sugar phosphate permease
MLSNHVARFLDTRGIHYGWLVAAVTFLTMLATAGAMGSVGVLIQPLEQEFGWTTAEISSALAIRLVFFGLFAPFAAAFMNRFGIRQVVTAALAMIAFGILLSFRMTALWQMMLLWGVVVGIGTGMTALVLGATIAARWFEQRRGLVVGLLTASNATGQLVFLPLLASLSETVGWRGALSFVVLMLALAASLVLLLMRDRPIDVGLAPYGAVTPVPAPPPGTLTGLATAPLIALRDAARAQVFWVLFFTFFICGFSTNGLIQTHWVSMCGDVGIAAVAAAGLLALIGIFDLVGTIGSGWLSDRVDNRWLLFWFYGLRGLSLLYLPFSGYSLPALSLFAVFYGLDWVATVPPTVKLAAEKFGPERAGMVFGWVFTGHQLGAAVAAYGSGAARTQFDTYLLAFIVAGVFCLLAALLILTVAPKAEPSPRRQTV